MRLILSVTVPIYLLIGLGWLVVRRGLFQKAEMRVLGRFVLYVSLPALVFNALAQRSLAEVWRPHYLAAYALGSMVLQLGVVWWQHRLRRLPLDAAAMRALGSASANSGFMGYPIAHQLLGPIAGLALALNMVVENLLVIPIALALADHGQRPQSRVFSAFTASLRGLARNPLILAIVAGLACALVGVTLPEPLSRSVGLVSQASAPIALFLIGGTLAGLEVRPGLLREVAQVALGKLVLMPALVAAFVWLLPVGDAPLRAAAVLFAAMPMIAVYPVLAQKYHQEDFCAAALLATTIASFFTISTLIWLMSEAVLGWL